MNYVLSRELAEAIKVSEITQRPLLIKGEPGTGKTLLAHYYAQENNLDIFEWNIKSTTKAQDGLYFYDALTRLNDSRFENKSGRNVEKAEDYIRLEAMGRAFSHDKKCILLIDEIDKADVEFPNDLLFELDKMQFSILETGQTIRAKIRPIVFITSNNERDLPDAFLRRCVFHYIAFPEWDMMNKIVASHFGEVDKSLLKSALETFYRLREIDDLSKKPSTSELIDWLKVLLNEGANPKDSLPYIGTLLKNEDDLAAIKKCF
jgi:MoxR-like ATPase